MPIYEYGCSKCGHEFEVLIRKESDFPTRCPGCGKGKPAKMFSSFAVSSAPAQNAASHCGSCPAAGATCPAEGHCPSG
ncbi:MAG: zinc ribbon domain-containing protein [Kiritimatiellia bacterium]|nr:zinc ribbon domain-containing protein [Kiritimatiellia bacterium]MDP6847280.1 zinc ribbon domain-containing protein [Kiritimatiellia bacterium]